MADKRPPRFRPRRLWGAGKKSRFLSQLSEEQLLLLSLLLVVLLAISMLYCLGFASLAVRDNWERAPLPWNGTAPAEELLSGTPAIQPGAGTTPP